jgi:hypothetical protein
MTLDSCQETTYRYQPLFSYRFKDAIGLSSTPDDIRHFLEDVYCSDDPFLTQEKRRREGIYPVFEKKNEPPVLVIKMVRYQHLLEKLINAVGDLKVVGLVRHPCGVLNSWFKTVKEFPAGASRRLEWEHAPCRNVNDTENVWGFRAWERVANLYLELIDRYPFRVLIQRYEDLVDDPIGQAERIINFCGLSFREQTRKFLRESVSTHNKNPYSVFKSNKVKNQWREELDEDIVDKVIDIVNKTRLRCFL